MNDRPGSTLISLAPAAGPMGHLLRAAVDAEQVGATRIHLPLDQPDFVATVAGLRRQTGLVITTDPDHPGADLVDRLPADFTEILLDADRSPTDLIAAVSRIVAAGGAAGGEVSVGGRGNAAVPVLFAALAVGADVIVGTALTPPEPPPADLRDTHGSLGHDDAALVARASGLARIAGRPAAQGRTARARWRIG